MISFPRQKLKYVASQVLEKLPYGAVNVPYVGLEHIRSWTGEIHINDSASPDGLVSFFKPGDILFGKLRPYLAKVALPGFSGVCSTEALVLRPKRSVDAGFLRYVLADETFIDEVDASTYGAKMPRASWEFIGSRAVPLPGLATQKQIADLLDRETARIDQLVEKNESLVATADERWRATLDNDILGHSYYTRLFQKVTHPTIDQIPSAWTLTPLKHLTDDRRPIMYGIVLPGPNVDDGVMIVKGGDVKPGGLKPATLCKTTVEVESKYERSRLRAGDLVIAIRGGIGDIEIVPPEVEGANLTQDAARIAPRSGVLNAWLRYALQAPSVFAPLEAKTLGAAVRGINIFDLKRIPVPTPLPWEQVNLADRLAAKEGKIAALKAKIERHNEKLKEFRSALITAAVTGQIDVDRWGRSGNTDRRLDAIEEEVSA